MDTLPKLLRKPGGPGSPSELGRGAAAALLLLVLWLIELHFGLVLALPLMLYLGLWLLYGAPAPPANAGDAALQTASQAYAECIRLEMDIAAQIDAIPDPQVREHCSRLSRRVAQILEVITEDRKHDVCLNLRVPLTFTHSLLVQYLRLIRRGHDPAEMRDRVLTDIDTLDQGFFRIQRQFKLEAEIDLEELEETIRETTQQLDDYPVSAALPPELPEQVANALPAHIAKMINSLTPRQLEILRMLPTGKTDEEIGDTLFIAKRTVTSHLTVIYSKIEARNRAEAVAFAMRWGLV